MRGWPSLLSIVLVIALIGPAGAWEQQQGAFVEHAGGSGGRVAEEGVHPGGRAERSATPLPEGAEGDLLLDRSGHVLAFASTGVGASRIVAVDAARGGIAWQTTGAAAAIRASCVAVAPDGTIWAQAADGASLLAIDPGDGTVSRTIPSPAGRCATGLHVLPGDRMALAEECCSDRIATVDLRTGAARSIPDSPVRHELLLTSDDGARAYAVAAASPLELLSIDLATGAVLDRVALPGAGLPFAPMHRALVVGGAIVLVTDAAVVRIDDDGSGRLREVWRSTPDATTGPLPASLAPAGPDPEAVVGWQAAGGADTLIAYDLDDGDVAWRTPSRPGPSGGVVGRLVTADADGDVVLPQIIDRSTEDGGILYDVVDADGVPVGQSPPDLGSGVGGLVIGDDGTLHLRTERAGVPTLVAVAPGPRGLVHIATEVRPAAVGAGIASIRVSGSAVAGVDHLVLRRGADVRRATAVRHDLVPYAVLGRFDLRGAAHGAWEVQAERDGVAVPLDATVQVGAPDAEIRLDVALTAPATVRNGRTGDATITVTNDANVDALGVPVVLQIDLGPDDPRTVLPAFESQTTGGGDIPTSAPPRVVQAGSASRFLMVALDAVPAGGDRVLPLRLDVPADAPDEGRIAMEVAVPACHGSGAGASTGPGAAFAQVGADPCFDAAIAGGGPSALDPIASGARQCVALELAALLTPVVRDDGLVEVRPRPTSEDLNTLAEDCIRAAAVSAGAGPFGIILALLQFEGLVHSTATAYLDCRLGEALDEAGVPGGPGDPGGGGGGGYGPGYDISGTMTGSSVDPNEIQGPPGAGDARYLTTTDDLGYRILFENLPGAAFAAQSVTITQTLDPSLDPESLVLGEVGFGGRSYPLPPVSGDHTALLEPPGADHRVRLRFTRAGRELTWRFDTLALTSDDPPADDAIGFLPPNATPPEGDGFVSYRVGAAPGVPDGTAIRAQASIVFDVNPPIVTGEWVNTVDTTPPATALSPIPSPSAANTVPFSWQGSDAVSGVVDAVVDVDRGAGFAPLPHHGPTSAAVVGEREEVLTVRVRSVDGAGNVEPSATAPTASVQIARDALDRLAGPTRIETAIDIARRTFGTAPVAVLARADTYPDSLVGAAVAARLGAPILLTNSGEVPAVLQQGLRDLQVGSVLVLGGAAAVGQPVVATLEGMGIAVERVEGSNRYATAAQVAQGLPGPRRAFLVEGAHADPRFGWPEALAVAPWAAQAGQPLLLAEADRLPPETAAAITELGVETVTIVGGPARISPAVEAAVAELGVAVERIGSDDRYATGLEVAAAAVAEGVASPRATWLATGEVFADALAAGAAVAATGGRLLLIHPADVAGAAQPVLAELAASEGGIGILRIAGGPLAVGGEVEAAIRAALR